MKIPFTHISDEPFSLGGLGSAPLVITAWIEQAGDKHSVQIVSAIVAMSLRGHTHELDVTHVITRDVSRKVHEQEILAAYLKAQAAEWGEVPA